jgi:hypothetical protein
VTVVFSGNTDFAELERWRLVGYLVASLTSHLTPHTPHLTHSRLLPHTSQVYLCQHLRFDPAPYSAIGTSLQAFLDSIVESRDRLVLPSPHFQFLFGRTRYAFAEQRSLTALRCLRSAWDQIHPLSHGSRHRK